MSRTKQLQIQFRNILKASQKTRRKFFYDDVTTDKEKTFREIMDEYTTPNITKEAFNKRALPFMKEIATKYYDWSENKARHPAIKKLIGSDGNGLYVDNNYGKGKDQAKLNKIATVILKEQDIPITDKNIAMIAELIYYS